MKKNLLIIHGGAPTAVINSSLYGAVAEAKKHVCFGEVYGAKGGSLGVLRGQFLRLDDIPDERLCLLRDTPASAIGTSRDHLEPEDYAAMAEVIARNNIGYVLYNGGNGSMEACGKLAEACAGSGVLVAGIPKTIDNDIAVTDHAPGFGSAARYIAATVREIAQDVHSLPIHVCVVEAMGRNTGWLTAAAALAGENGGHAPHLLCLPETPFDEEAFLAEVERLHKAHGGVVVVTSEGLRDKQGQTIVPPIFEVDRSVYFGDVSAHLSNLVIQKLGVKARSEKPGLCGRASMAHQSAVDRAEAETAGREAVKAVANGTSGVMVGFRRLPGAEYRVEPFLIPIEEVMLHERTLPPEFIAPGGHGVTPAFADWCRPLLGGALPRYF